MPYGLPVGQMPDSLPLYLLTTMPIVPAMAMAPATAATQMMIVVMEMSPRSLELLCSLISCQWERRATDMRTASLVMTAFLRVVRW
ncbi:hypothetical protein ACFYZT_32505 [Streptomyces sp. NPDC001591]|uniref:hypothetical protein n=1 Tax=Streptomyces sp. NPDC001591 TaxID=3364589 RepID=UPI0036AC50A8